MNSVLKHLLIVASCIILVAVLAIYINKNISDGELVSNEPSAFSDNSSEVITDFKWEPYYAGGFGQDKVITLDESSVRISTGLDGGWYGAVTKFSSVDLSNQTISFSVRVSDWNELDKLMVLISTDGTLENYYGLNLKNYFAKPASGEWIDLTLEPSTFSRVEGLPDLSDITTVALRVVPKTGDLTRVWFDKFDFNPKSNKQNGTVTLAFDDGFSSVLKAKNAMAKYGYKGTAFVIPEILGNEEYLKLKEVDELSRAGWDISAHGGKNLVEMSVVDVDTHLANTFLFLKANNYQGYNHYAYPNGGYNESVRSQTMEYFTSARTIDGFLQPVNSIESSRVSAVTVSSSTPISQVLAVVDDAIKNDSWLILVWHNFTENPTRDVDYRLDDFVFLLDYLNKNDVKVTTYSEAFATFKTRSGQ